MRLYNGIDVTAFGSHKRVEITRGVFDFALRTRGFVVSAIEDLNGTLGAHDGKLGRRPCDAQVVPHGLAVHHDVRTAVCLTKHHTDARHRRFGIRKSHLRAVTDHPPPLEVFAGEVPRRIDERDDRKPE